MVFFLISKRSRQTAKGPSSILLCNSSKAWEENNIYTYGRSQEKNRGVPMSGIRNISSGASGASGDRQ